MEDKDDVEETEGIKDEDSFLFFRPSRQRLNGETSFNVKEEKPAVMDLHKSKEEESFRPIPTK